MADECAHDQWERDEHGRCHGCGRLFPDIIADLRAQNARLLAMYTELLDARPTRGQLTSRAQRLEEALRGYMAQFGQALEAHSIPFGEAQMAADERARAALAGQEETKTCRGCGHPDGGCGYDCECVAEFHVRRWQEAGE